MSTQPMLMMMQTAPAGGASGAAAFLFQMIPFLLVGFIIYLFVFRPQQQQMKAHREAIAAVKKGDEVVTAGGHIGKVTKVYENEVEVEFAAGQRHRVVKSMLSEVRTSGAKPAND
jgi:preprotein translocase subunit YajC